MSRQARHTARATTKRECVAPHGQVNLFKQKNLIVEIRLVKHGATHSHALRGESDLNAPSIDEVDVSDYTGAQGSPIYIRTEDDFAIQRVQVAVAGTDGAQLEAGEASLEAGGTGRWVYRAGSTIPTGTDVRISVTSTDRPGSAATMDTDKKL